MAAPRNGAVEKYAPVRAEPGPRSASTNNTRLTPYPSRPTPKATPTMGPEAKRAPSPVVWLSLPDRVRRLMAVAEFRRGVPRDHRERGVLAERVGQFLGDAV